MADKEKDTTPREPRDNSINRYERNHIPDTGKEQSNYTPPSGEGGSNPPRPKRD